MAQLHSFVFEDCHKSFFQFDPQVVNLLVVARIFKDHVNFIHVSNAQNPVYRLKVNEFAVLSTSEFCLREC